MSLLEGVWARGDRRLGRVLQAAYRRGCRFDGWGDKLNFGAWLDAFAEVGVDPDFYTTRQRDTREPLPWDHIDILVGKAFLKSEWEKALAAGLTADCRFGQCNACGVCDFDTIAPQIHHRMTPPAGDLVPAADFAKPAYRKLQVSYAKLCPARFFGHLELVNIFLRALRRAGIPVKFSEGFHPKPKVAFSNPLPTGTESEDERMVITVSHEVTPAVLLQRLNAQLPEGLHVFACSEDIEDPPSCSTFRISFGQSLPEPLKASIMNIDFDRELVVYSPKGKLKKIALRDILNNISMSDPGCLDMTLCCEPGKAVRPAEVLKQVFALTAEVLGKAGIRKLKDSSHV
jgi:radical SAM-linked protein